MAKRNLKYESGYQMGYNWISNEGGRIDNIDNELKLRDSNYNRHKRSQWDHAFADGAKDAKNGLIKRY